MLKRLLLGFCALLTAAVGHGQLIAWELSVYTNDPQDNDGIAESMVRVPGGDVIIATVTGNKGSNLATLKLARVSGSGVVLWDITLGTAYKDVTVPMVISGTTLHLIQTYINNWHVINVSNGAIAHTFSASGLGSDLVAHPGGDLVTLDKFNGTITRWSGVTGASVWTVNVTGNLEQLRFLRGDANGNLYVGGSYYTGLVENGFGVTKVDSSGSVGWTAAYGNQDFPPVADEPADIAVDPGNNAIYVTARQNYNSYDDDFSVTKFNLTTGAFVWNQMFDNGGSESGKYIRRLSDGSVLAVSTGGQAVRISSTGAVMWSNTFYSNEGPYGVVVNSSDDIFLGLSDYGNRPDYLVRQINPVTGIAVKEFRYDSAGLEVATGLSLAADGNIIVNGSSRSGGFRRQVVVKFQQANITLSPNPIAGGQSAVGTVTLVGGAPSSGYSLTLGSLNSAVASPVNSNLSFASGETSKTFTVNSSGVSSSTTAYIYAYKSSGAFMSFGTNLTVAPSTLSALSLTPTNMVGGALITGTVTLSSPAPAAGLIVYLADNSASATVDSICYVAPNQSTGEFYVDTKPVTSTTNVIVYAHYAGTTFSKTFQLLAPSLNGLTVPSSIVGGTGGTGSVAISGNAPTGGWGIALSDDSPSVSVSSSTTVPAGSATTTFNILTTPVTTTSTATITAKRGATTKTASLTIKPPTVSSFTLLPDALVGGQSTTGLIVLSSAAPAGGVTATIQNGAPSKVTTPSSLYIPAGASSRAFIVTTNTVTVPLTVGVYVTLNGTTFTRYLYLLP